MTSAQVVGGAVITIRPQFTNIGPGLNREFRQAAPQMEKHGRDAATRFVGGFGARIRTGPFRSFGGVIGTGVVAGLTASLGGAALQGVFKIFTTGFSEVSDASKGLAQTNAVIASTGGAAHVTAGHVVDLASSIQSYSGQTDDAIQQSENLLLSFTGIRNEVGKGNDVFDQATKAVADMSQALGQDTKSSAIQLGKALNDPIRGVTALQRVGVSFTDSQRKQIKALVDSGHTLQAQKIILGEVNREFGGVARSFGQSAPGQIARAKRAFEDVSQSLVATLLPAFNKVMPLVTRGIQALPVIFAKVDRVVRTVLPPIAGFVGWMIRSRNVLIPVAAGIGAVVAAIKVWTVVTRGIALATAALNVVLAANPIGIVALAVIGIATALVVAYKRSETFRHVVQVTFDWIKGHWPLLLGILTGPIGLAAVFVITHWRTVHREVGFIWHGIENVFSDGASFVLRMVGHILGGFAGLVHAGARLPGPLGAPFRAVGSVIDGAKAKLDNLSGAIDRATARRKYIDLVVRITGSDVLPTPGSGAAWRIAETASMTRAAGGWIKGPWRGPRADNMLIRANPLEYVIQAPTAMAIEQRAPGWLDALNAGAVPVGGDPSGAWFGVRPPGFARGGSVPYIQSWLRAQDPKPYVWGGVGPGGFDCSGLVGAVWALTQGLAPFRRYFTTATFPGFDGFRPGTRRGGFNVGVNPATHMAGNLGGLGFEAQSTATGIHVGSGVTPVSAFAQQWYLPGIAAALTLRQMRAALRLITPALVAETFRELGFRRADSGGGLRWPSGTARINTSGQDEYVWRRDQLGGGPSVVVHSLTVDARGAADPRAVGREVEAGISRAIRDLARHLKAGPGAL